MMSRKERTPITKQQQKKFHIFSFQTHRNANKKKKKKDKTMAETKREYNNGNVRQTNNNRKKVDIFSRRRKYRFSNYTLVL